jgi:hypothetical protein
MKGLLIDIKSDILFSWLILRFFRNIENKYIKSLENIKRMYIFVG